MRWLAVLVTVSALGLFTAAAQAGGWCYRPAYAAPAYHGYSYYQPTYYETRYVPYALEVYVNKDRYYALSDLYRDRLYLEMFDTLREMRERSYNERAPAQADRPAPMEKVDPSTPRAAAPRVQGKTSERALLVLKTHCVSCHGKNNEHIDLSDPDTVSTTKRWAAFGMAASADMPKAPAALLAPGKEKELSDWKREHALKDDELKALYDEWVMVTRTARK